MTGIEPVTSSLPRKHSTPELHRLLCIQKLAIRIQKNQIPLSKFKISWGEQDSNLRRRSQRIYSPPSLAAWVSPQTIYILVTYNFEPMEGLEPTTCWLQISCSSQLSYGGKDFKELLICFCECKYKVVFLNPTNIYETFLIFFFKPILSSWLTVF